MVTAATESTFEQEVLESDTAVLVDFWAEWCGPCHAVSPILEKIVEERNGDLRLVKVNIDEEQELARRYGIMSIPAMIIFRDGEPA
jgi:thioredoxin 1